jgi:hypothetical protein
MSQNHSSLRIATPPRPRTWLPNATTEGNVPRPVRLFAPERIKRRGAASYSNRTLACVGHGWRARARTIAFVHIVHMKQGRRIGRRDCGPMWAMRS